MNNDNKDNFVLEFDEPVDLTNRPLKTSSDSNQAGNNYNSNFNSFQSFNSGNNHNYDSGYNPGYQNPGINNPERNGIKAGFMEGVISQTFVFMCIALIITAITSITVASSPTLLYKLIMDNTTFYGLLIAEIAVVLITNYTLKRDMVIPSAVLFAAYSVINGITLSIIFLVYTTTSITTVLFITAGLFGAMAAYGMITKRDLTKAGSLCAMGLIGVIIASIVNMFMGNSTMDIIISSVSVLVFVGLTAYDTQKMKALAARNNSVSTTTLALFCAIQLYLDVINLFLDLLRLFGKKN